MNRTTSQLKQFAELLLSFEATLEPHADTYATPAFRVCEKLRRSLSILAGKEGYRALLARALTLAKAEVPALSAVQVNADGTLGGLNEQKSTQKVGRFTTGEVILVAQLIGLLITFIGEVLTLRMLKDIWHQVPANSLNSVKGKNL